MATSRPPNTRLRALLEEADCTLDTLARSVNALGAAEGRRLSYDRSSVAHWLAGSRPRPPVPRLVCEVLTRRTGRLVTPYDAGFGGVPRDGPEGPTPVGVLLGLGRAGVQESRHVPVRHLPLPASLVQPPPSGAAGPPRGEAGDSPVGRAAAVRAVTRHFADGFDAFGGSYGRTALSAYVADTLAPWLRQSGPEPVPDELLRETAVLVFLIGRMHGDNLLHGAAQQCFLTAARLAAEAGDPASWAMAMSTVSAQAGDLGHHALSRQTAEAAVRAAPALTPAQHALAQVQVAVARAASGDTGGARRALEAADGSARLPAGRDGAFPTYHRTAYEYRLGIALWTLDDRNGAIGAWRRALALCRPDHRRTVALGRARTARALLDVGRVGEACHHLDALLRMRHEVRARAVDHAVEEARARLRPYAAHPDAAPLLARMGAALPAGRTV